MPRPINGPGDNAEIVSGLEDAIAKQVALHPTSFGTGLMKRIQAAVDRDSLPALIAALSKEERKLRPNTPYGDVQQALAQAPDLLAERFVFENAHRIRTGYSEFEINPPGRGRDPTLESTSIGPNENGGVTLRAGEGFDAFTGAEWLHNVVLADYTTPSEAQQLRDANFNVDNPTSVLVVQNSSEDHPVILAFGGMPFEAGKVACICTSMKIVQLEGGRTDFVLEKPVVYFYPQSKTHLTVQVELDGEFIAEYPKSEGGVWNFVGSPDGMLFEPKTERKFSYLFWEGKAAGSFQIDRQQAFCVAGGDSASFLENVANRFGFNDRERTDFISYWIARLEQNRYNVVQFLSDAEYDQYAKMTVEPKPDTVIRLFMIYQGTSEPVETGRPELPARFRKGFTVVEWGGCEI